MLCIRELRSALSAAITHTLIILHVIYGYYFDWLLCWRFYFVYPSWHHYQTLLLQKLHPLLFAYSTTRTYVCGCPFPGHIDGRCWPMPPAVGLVCFCTRVSDNLSASLQQTLPAKKSNELLLLCFLPSVGLDPSVTEYEPLFPYDALAHTYAFVLHLTTLLVGVNQCLLRLAWLVSARELATNCPPYKTCSLLLLPAHHFKFNRDLPILLGTGRPFIGYLAGSGMLMKKKKCWLWNPLLSPRCRNCHPEFLQEEKDSTKS